MDKLQSLIFDAIKLLAKPAMVFYTLAWLMVLLVLGTVAQRYVGLYLAQATFFYSWIWWVGPVPLPGGLPTLGILTIALVTKLATATLWTRAQAGIITTHIGALLLMLGGLITFLGAKDGEITLFADEKSSYFTAYHDRELVIEDAGDLNILARHPWSRLRVGRIFDVPGGGQIEILKICRNCAFTAHSAGDDLSEYRGRAQDFGITPIAHELEDEINRSAILFRLSGTGSGKDGIHLSADFIDQSPWFSHGDQTINIALRKKRYALPFSVELKNFTHDRYAGTEVARHYASDVIIHDAGTLWAATIRMNEPLRYRGYTLYQASFVQSGPGPEAAQGSVLAVVQNKGRIFPYLASLVMAMGLLIHIALEWGKRRQVVAMMTAMMMVVMPMSAQAGEGAPKLYLEQFEQLPILDQGRVKPMDTFARASLEIFSGKDRVGDLSASEWLAALLLDPEQVKTSRVFRIVNPVVREMLKLPLEKGNRYSIDQVLPRLEATKNIWEPLVQIDPKRLSMPQRQLLELIEHVDAYIELSRALAMVRPQIDVVNPERAKQLGLSDLRVSFWELQGARDAIAAQIKKLIDKAERTRPDRAMSPDEIALLQMATQMQEIQNHPNQSLFRVIPPVEPNTEWQTLWVAMQDPAQIKIIENWQALARAYTMQDQHAFNVAARRLLEVSKTSDIHAELSVEYVMNNWQPFRLSLIFYTITLACVVLMMGLGANSMAWRGARVTMMIAILCHVIGLLARIYITGRPPVTNLYDSIIFVGLVAVIAAILGERRARDGVFLLLGALTGVMLQSIGLKFDAEGDTIRVLVAVLDTNFWLSTHVTMITMGYGLAILTGLMAHAAMIQPLLPHKSANDNARPLDRRTLDLAVIALFFTATGTILGGIWADQSWGRFWGWDPKENGALLIVLWLIWTLHGRYSGHLKDALLLAAFAMLPIVVACAWFGVNLLGVGLHSYGFTESAMVGFVTFCVVDFMLIAGLWIAHKIGGRQIDA